MLFNSYEFIFLFLPITLLSYFLVKSARLKLFILAISSYLFYGYWNYKFLPLLLLSTMVDFYIGKKLGDNEDHPLKRKYLLWTSLVLNLGLLGFFKYFNFFMESAAFISGGHFDSWNIILPVGISFYTFQSMSYTIDIYRGHQKPYDDFLAFATYVSFFPQLVAGPIVRHDELVPQFITPKDKGRLNWDDLTQGSQRFIIGLAKKILIADTIGVAIDQALIHLPDFSTLEAWMCALGYTFQIYYDFSGYSDMAIGLGRMFGFTFPENFHSPYKSKSITEFWRRWHMTLSFWLRDYLYISLGGNRSGKWGTYKNLILTMLLGGLWHGANWVFVIWGIYHGLLLAIERFFKGKLHIPDGVKYFGTFFLVVFGWVVFRSPDVAFALLWFKKMFVLEGGLDYWHFVAKLRDKYYPALLVGALLCFFAKSSQEFDYNVFRKKRWLLCFAVTFIWIVLGLSQESPFLYFQF